MQEFSWAAFGVLAEALAGAARLLLDAGSPLLLVWAGGAFVRLFDLAALAEAFVVDARSGAILQDTVPLDVSASGFLGGVAGSLVAAIEVHIVSSFDLPFIGRLRRGSDGRPSVVRELVGSFDGRPSTAWWA